jgi:ketosteroid isomerase-like protein
VEVVQAYVQAYGARDLDAALALCAPDVKAAPDRSVFPEAGPVVGQDEYRAFLEETWAPWARGETQTREILDLNDGRVLVRADWRVQGSASGAHVAPSLSAIVAVENGLIVRVQFDVDHDAALRAVGLQD